MGGAGEKGRLKLVAQYGDACNFNADVETVRHKLDVLREHCHNVGRDYDSILKTLEFYTILGDRREDARAVRHAAPRAGQYEPDIRSCRPRRGDATALPRVTRT